MTGMDTVPAVIGNSRRATAAGPGSRRSARPVAAPGPCPGMRTASRGVRSVTVERL
jgi:hypothetical protein